MKAKQMMIALATATALMAVPLAPVAPAQTPDPATRPAAPAAPNPGNMAMMPMMQHMRMMARVQAVLEEAKGAAEAQGNKVVVAKIDEALRLVEREHLMMHRPMARTPWHMPERAMMMQGRMQCPMCGNTMSTAPTTRPAH